MDLREIAVSTMTWARSREEEAVLGRSLERLSRTGVRVAVADRGTSATFTTFLEALPGFSVTVPPEEGLVAQAHACIHLAAGFRTPFILYTEPDKELFFADRMREFVSRAPAGESVGVVLASRSDESLGTYPPMQRYAEGVINRLCGEVIGPSGDYSYGPFLMNRTLLPNLATLDRRLGWGWRHFAFRTAARTGLRVVHLVDDYPCPPDQRVEDDDDRLHRMRQLSQNILGLTD